MATQGNRRATIFTRVASGTASLETDRRRDRGCTSLVDGVPATPGPNVPAVERPARSVADDPEPARVRPGADLSGFLAGAMARLDGPG
jgi:hypothetical protein